MKTFRYLNNVSTLRLDTDTCIGCEECTRVCPHQVFECHDKKAVIIDKDACMECGACALNCPSGALSVSPGVGCAAYVIKTWIYGKDAKTACC